MLTWDEVQDLRQEIYRIEIQMESPTFGGLERTWCETRLLEIEAEIHMT